MGRLRTIGYEAQGVSSVANFFEGRLLGNTPTFDTSKTHGGAKSLRFDSGASNSISMVKTPLYPEEAVLDRNYFLRVYVNIATAFALDIVAGVLGFAEFAIWRVRLTLQNTLQLIDNDGNQVGSDSQPLSLDAWHLVEVSWKVGSGTGANDSLELRLDGVVVAGDPAIDLSAIDPVVSLDFGLQGNPGANKVMNIDDIALNDDQGTEQNSYPGPGKVVLLKPISDAQVGSWTGGAGGTTNLWEAVNNTPPIGTASETDLTQIERTANVADNATTEYRANLTTYADAGISDEDKITVVQAVIDHGEDASTGTKTGSMAIHSNPTQSGEDTFTFGDDVGPLGTWPTSWRTKWGQAQNNPSVVMTTSPVLRVRKTDSGGSARTASVDFMGIYVEYLDNESVMQPMMGMLSPILAD